MHVARTIEDIRQLRAAQPRRLGVVPTMGALHAGHLALLRAARRECEAVAATLFVNPTQFGPTEDFATYPRDETRDLCILERERVDVAFLPSAREIYPHGAQATVRAGRMGRLLEGRRRPGHLDGVATVVARLFESTAPRRAYFGQKDWQQARVVAQLIQDQRLDVELRVVATVRDSDGLACSSRNAGLAGADRHAALSLWRGLQAAGSAWDAGERSSRALENAMSAPVWSEPRARLDYAAVRHALTLEPVEPATEPVALLIAAQVGNVRLIDNIVRGVSLVRG